jgi:hypothetical protein
VFVLTFSSVNHGLDGEQSNAPPPLWRRLAGMKSKWDRLRSLTATIKDQSLDYVNAGLCDGGGFTELLVGRFLTQYVTRSSCCKSNCIARYLDQFLEDQAFRTLCADALEGILGNKPSQEKIVPRHSIFVYQSKKESQAFEHSL